METWKPIPGFSRYEASSEGRLRSLNYKRTSKIQILCPALSADGYLKTMLLDDTGKYRSWMVHKFVMLAFVGLVPNGKEINHKDGVKLNNRAENLEYVTRSENCLHSFRLGLQVRRRGSLNGMAKLTEKQVKDIREYRKTRGRYYGRERLAKKYGISIAQIKAIVTRRRNIWPHV
jgi:hypothetical protein